MRKTLKTYSPNMPLWLIPMLYVVAAVVCGLVLPRLEQEYLAAYSHGMAVASAQATLSAIASGMMALTGIVFALAFVMVQFSAIAYSPRLVAWFGRDPVLFHSLGLFTATFFYALVTLAWIDRGGNGRVPLFSVLLVTVLLILSMMVFAKLVQRLNDIQITNVLHFVGQQGREVIRAIFPHLDAPAGATPESWRAAVEEAQQRPVTQTLRYSGEPCTVAQFQIAALVRQAQAVDAVIVMECAVGDTLTEDTPLLRVHGGREPLAEAPLRQAIQVARERTFEQDPKYPLRLLVDIAIKALSPAINDPTTAVQAIDQIEDLLHRLGRRALDAGCVMDDQGAFRLVFPTPTWEDYLTLAFDEIRQYGASFDRSWYNRAGVERVMGFCTEEQAQRFLQMAPPVEKAMVESGIILIKYWLEVSPDEQTRRLEARIEDGRKIWKLSPMDLLSYSRWYDYSRARDAMFAATDTAWAPWFVARSDDKKRARLNIIRHLLSRIPYEDVPREKVKLPKRQKAGDYREPDYPFKFIPETF